MKPHKDWTIKLLIKLQSTTKGIQFQCSVHTNIHALKISICKQLKLVPLQTSLQIFNSKHHVLKSTSTLLQNDIIQDSVLFVKILNQNLKDNSNSTKINSLECGLSLKYFCKNQKCISFKKDSILSLGFGQFDIKECVDKIICPVCPYKTQKSYCQTGCKQIIVKNCVFQITAIEVESQSIFKQKVGKWIKSLEQKQLDRELEFGQKQIGKIINIKRI